MNSMEMRPYDHGRPMLALAKDFGKEYVKAGFSMAKNFAIIGGIYQCSECGLEKLRAKTDLYNRCAYFMRAQCAFALRRLQRYGGMLHGGAFGAQRWPSRFAAFRHSCPLPALLTSVPFVPSILIILSGMERAAFMGGGCASFAAFSVVIDHFMKFS